MSASISPMGFPMRRRAARIEAVARTCRSSSRPAEVLRHACYPLLLRALPSPAYLELDGLDAYANHYRFGAGGPRVVYYGGAVSRAVYEQRKRTAPTIVAEVFATACDAQRVRDVDLVVCPCPIATDDDDETWVSEHHGALSERLGSGASPLATVGYSAGARFALVLAILEGADGVSCFGGAGVGATLGELEPVLRARTAPLRLLHLMNAGDPLGLAGTPWAPRLRALVALTSETAPGGHPFADYASNGFVARAFAHALAALRP